LMAQPFILPLRSFHEWLRNAYFFAALGGVVFMLRNLPIDDALRGILRIVAVTGGISTLFGYIQNFASNMEFPYILNTKDAPDRFLGNTGLDNLLGAYLALAILAGVWLLLNNKKSGKLAMTVIAFDFFLLAFNCAGIWRTGTRSAFIACIAGIMVLLAFSRFQPGTLKKCLKALAVITFLAVCVVFISPGALQVERRDMTKLFTSEALSASQEGRYSIWLTTWEMIKAAPLLGVGLGNYKWNYMDALAVSQEISPLRPRYTYWAHNEYLQWIAETGAIGGVLFFSLLIYCIGLCLRGMRGENNDKKPFLAWSLAALTVLMADSCFSRPLHHVDTAFTLSLALAMISRLEGKPVKLTSKMRFGVSGVILSLSLSGIILFSQSFQGQGYLGKYYYNPLYISLISSEEREQYSNPLLLEDAYLRLTARENYNRSLIEFEDAEQNDRDAIRLLTKCFDTQPGYEELNYLMLLYQKRGEIETAQRYFKYYPPEERQKLLDGRFDGNYMMK